MKNNDITKDNNNGYVRVSEFDELKEMFLLMMQKLESMASDITSIKVEQKRMGVEQKRMGVELERVGVEQKRMGVELERVGVEQKRMAKDITSIRRDVGGLSRSVSYALENEAYRELPGFLKAKYGIELLDSLIRTEIKKDFEINILGEGTRHGKPVLIVGEAKLRLQRYYTSGTSNNLQMVDVFEQLERNVEAVRLQCKDAETDADGNTKEIVRILITHFATKDFLKEAEDKNVIVIQSHEWQAPSIIKTK
ncbi:hypothetical protein [Candidatus Magnetobacterium casense]|uniref:hypothetical protein n=1 Tax=Candidatus Magnetobacterium casense TaxID=1455061 RepID=UPI00058EADEC|nr:hypothetical protein [Candidatus Magnetobacterium casensis]